MEEDQFGKNFSYKLTRVNLAKIRKIIFLGKWCCLFDRKDKWSKLDYQISNFHWDDRNKFQSDFIKLETTYEEFLNELHPYLNKLHKKKYSKRFWKF